MDILRLLRPSLWFAAHLHTKFAAVVPHFEEVNSGGNGANHSSGDNVVGDVGWGIDRDKSVAGGAASGGNTSGGAPVEFCRPTGTQCMTTTKFLALDKCLPGRDFLQIVEVPVPSTTPDTIPCHGGGDNSTFSGGGYGGGYGGVPPLPPTPPPRLQYDPEWLAILRRTHTLLSTSRVSVVTIDSLLPSPTLSLTLLSPSLSYHTHSYPPSITHSYPLSSPSSFLGERANACHGGAVFRSRNTRSR